jgi:hypothetical protein
MVCLTSYCGIKDFRDKLPMNQVFEYFGTIFVHTLTYVIRARKRKITEIFQKLHITATYFIHAAVFSYHTPNRFNICLFRKSLMKIPAAKFFCPEGFPGIVHLIINYLIFF